jgi:polyribonucleotide nucleotidyltransferase
MVGCVADRAAPEPTSYRQRGWGHDSAQNTIGGKFMKKIFEMNLAGRPLVVETGELAQFANGACLIRYGETVIMSTATASKSPRPGIDFFPLSVDYEEKLYSVGRFPGGFIKREGRPTEKAILTSRVIDRPMRPLFPKDLRNDVSINNLVMSVEQDNAPEVVAMIGSSIAVSISDIPWNGPIGGVHVGIVDDEIIVNPTEEQRLKSTLQLTLAGTEEKVCMIEAGANEVPENVMLDAIIKGHEVIKEQCRFIKQIVSEIGKEKFEYISLEMPAEVYEAVAEFAGDSMREAVLSPDKSVRDLQIDDLKSRTAEHLESVNPEWTVFAGEAIYKLEKKTVRNYLFKEHKRVDGRGLNDIRQLSAQVDILPRVHGSGLFQRGQTQVLTTCTLATLSKVQVLDGLDNEDQKRYIHHYNFPGYSVGEAKSARSPGRREIGHGALAERSLVPVLPSEEEFPYAIRCVSEILMSNGSTSQGSVCASTLALMAAGVPIKKPVAGISSGLIVNEENENDYLVFMDIQGIEDFFGDMDFKVAGTVDGITSIQVDIKVDGLSYDIIRDAFEMTRKGRLQIINDVIIPCIDSPRSSLSSYAPKIEKIDIPSDKIRDIIGQGGKVIRKITEETNTEIDIEEDGAVGHVYIASPNSEAAAAAIARIRSIAFDPEPGTVFDGVVTRLMAFGAFVEIAPGKEGLVHISKLAWRRVEKVEDVLEVGQSVRVKVLEVDGQGRLNLSVRDCQEKPADYTEVSENPRSSGRSERPERRRDSRFPDSRGGDRGGRPSGERGYHRSDRGGSDRSARHNPAGDDNSAKRNQREF